MQPFSLIRTSATLAALFALAACAGAPKKSGPDPRVGLKGGLTNAGEAASNLKVVSETPAPKDFLAGVSGTFDRVNSDITFTGNYAIQGNFNGLQIWDMSNPANPTQVASYPCPASQNDVSVFRNLLFMSSEGTSSRLDCSAAGITDTVSKERVRGLRIFDISNIRAPKLIASVQTCRGSHTHTVVEDPKDRENIYIYISGSAGIRSPSEVSGCVRESPDSNPNSSLWRIEIIKVPLAHPEQAAVINRANIFSALTVTPAHAPTELDLINAQRAADSTRAAGGFVAKSPTTGRDMALSSFFTGPQLDSIVKARGRTGTPTGADSAALRAGLQRIVDRVYAAPVAGAPISANRQCHDITVYPSKGLAGGACEGHGLLLDISDVANPRRISAVSDSNFAYWHSATFNNDGTKILFSDEWGGGTQAKCRASDKKEWGADAIFEIVNGKMEFRSYYKISAPQTDKENCVAHNGSLIPIPGRDVMAQAWYQGGVSIFDFTDARNPKEIAYFDRGPLDSTRLILGGSWSAYWYNGSIMSSEISRGLDVFQLKPSEFVTQNEIDASNTVKLAYLNAQGQPQFNWPASYPLARAYLDQLERNMCLTATRIAALRQGLADAEKAGTAGRAALKTLAASLTGDMASSCDPPKVRKLQTAIQDLGAPVVP